MRGFIEVTGKDSGKKYFINVDHISFVNGSEISLDYPLNTEDDRFIVLCSESYDEIKMEIRLSPPLRREIKRP